jgi:hypothetical protein
MAHGSWALRRWNALAAGALAASLFGSSATFALQSAKASPETNTFTAATLSTPGSLATIHPSVTGTGDGNVQLTWSDSLTRAVTFEVQRAPASSPTSWATINGGGSGQSSSALCTGSVPGTVSCTYDDNSTNSTSAPAYNSPYVYQVIATIGAWQETSAGDLAESLPPTGGTDTYLLPVNLNAVSAENPTNIWAVGASCTIDYYNGTSWTTQSVSSSVCPTGTSLNGVAANSGSPMIVGSGGVSFICTASCTTSSPTWTAESTGTTNSLNAVSAENSTNMWAVGASCTVLYYNGTTWASRALPPTVCAAGTSLNGVSANALGPSPSPYLVGNSGLLVLCSASCTAPNPTWNKVASGTTNNLLSVSTGANNYDVAVGAAGTITTCTGGCAGGGATWATMTSGTSNSLNGVFGSSATSFLAVGASGTVLSCTASCNAGTGTWTSQSTGTTSSLQGVTATSATGAFAVGGSGTILTLASSWSSQASNITPTIPTSYSLAAADLTQLSNPDGTTYTDQAAWPATGLGTSCTAGTNPGLLLQTTPTLPSGYTTISNVVATVVYGANATPGTGAGFQLLVSANGGTSWTPYPLTNPGTGGASVTTSVTITSTVATTADLQNMQLCFQGTSGSGPSLTTSIDLVHVDVN